MIQTFADLKNYKNRIEKIYIGINFSSYNLECFVAEAT